MENGMAWKPDRSNMEMFPISLFIFRGSMLGKVSDQRRDIWYERLVVGKVRCSDSRCACLDV